MSPFITQTIFTLLSIIKERKLSHESLNSRNKWNQNYDFIVVGGGTAGSVVAARLAEDFNKSILLIEAGGPQSIRSDIPALEGELTGGILDWNYTIVPQKNAFIGFIDNKRNISRGKAFGGCSMHNSMNYYRENPEYYNLWMESTGVKNWNYSYVLPYFLKSENNLDKHLVANDPTVHTIGGPVSITTAIPDPILMTYLKASPGLGYPITYQDGRNPFGSTIMQRNVLNGVRQSTSLAYLEHNHKSNLHILGQTLVTKILFNDNKRAVGVQFFRGNIFYNVFARTEVIISAGSPESPQLLMLSGVGQRKHLEKLDIPVLSDRNVGEFRYQMFSTVNFDIRNQSLIEKPIKNFRNFYKYFIRKRGPLAYIASGYTNFKKVPYYGRPQLSNGLALPRTTLIGTDLEELVRDYKLKEQWRQYYRPYLNRTTFGVRVVLSRPQGTGIIRLRTKNPLDYPIIDPRYFGNQQDLDDLVKTFKLSMDLFMSPVMRKVIEIFKIPVPGCTPCSYHYFCDSYIRCVVTTNTGDVYPTGGCRIGVATDHKAVVDQRLRVFGVSSLRVIDSSILPVGTDQSAAISIMIGEYGADMIKEDNRMNRGVNQK